MFNGLLSRKTVVMGEAPEESSRCGVVKLKGDGESTKLPFTMMGGAKWVPLAYFEGEVELKKNRGQSKTPHSPGGRFESWCQSNSFLGAFLLEACCQDHRGGGEWGQAGQTQLSGRSTCHSLAQVIIFNFLNLRLCDWTQL